MKATVKEITVSTVKVEYEDGTYALVPIEKMQNKEAITQTVSSYNHTIEPFDKVSDVPVSVGEVLEVTGSSDDVDVDYRDARLAHYPRVNRQMDAAYWAREGDDTQQKAVDAEILNVKTKIPKTWTGKQSEVDSLMD